MPRNWTYDGSIERWPLKPGELWSCAVDGHPKTLGKVMVRDLYNGLPGFMSEADCVFVDPPWNRGNENSFRTKAGVEHHKGDFADFLGLVLACIRSIAPATCFVEMGKEYVGLVEQGLRRLYPHVRTYPATYYRRHPCFIVRAGRADSSADFGGWDEQVVARICEHERFDVIADPCMGRGVVGYEAFRHGRQFRGTELNPARLAVLVNKIAQLGGQWDVDGARYEPQPG
jgi:hypothetical protein